MENGHPHRARCVAVGGFGVRASEPAMFVPIALLLTDVAELSHIRYLAAIMTGGCLQLCAGWLRWSSRSELFADCLAALSAGKLALALAIEASLISIAS
jgi:hypothetical protein